MAHELVAEKILTEVDCNNLRSELVATKVREALVFSQLESVKRETRREK